MQRFNIIKRDREYYILVKKRQKKDLCSGVMQELIMTPLVDPFYKKVGVLLIFSLNGVLHVVHCSSPPPPYLTIK